MFLILSLLSFRDFMGLDPRILSGTSQRKKNAMSKLSQTLRVAEGVDL